MFGIVPWITVCLWIMILPAKSISSKSSSLRHTCAVIGGGIAGLSCAHHLSDSFAVTLFDTGRLRPGGRASSRLPGDPAKKDDLGEHHHISKCVVDHAAQVLFVPDHEARFAEFSRQVKDWERIGVVTRFPEGSLYNIYSQSSTKKCIELEPFVGQPAYFGSSTMGIASISNALAETSNFEIQQNVWVSPSNGARYMPKTRQWKVTASGKVLGYFDRLIVAHNGKCADRLMSKTPAKAIHDLLRVNFAPSVPQHGGKRMTLNSIYSLTIALPKNSAIAACLPANFLGGFIQNDKALRFLSCQSRKYESMEKDVEIWTILSSSNFVKSHKAPQEFLPNEVVEEVTLLLIEALKSLFGVTVGSIKPIERRLQLWGAGVPLNTWENGKGFLYDAESAVGVCGDWLLDSSIAGAWTSGRLLADHLKTKEAVSAGFDGTFVASQGASNTGIAAINEKFR